MEILFPDRRPPDRRQVLDVLRRRLDAVLGRSLRCIAEPPPGAPAADFLALDGQGALLVVRWLEPDEWPAGLPDLLVAYDRMRRDLPRLVRRLPIEPPPTDTLTLTWILVGAQQPDHWAALAPLLAVPMRFLRAHLLTSEDGGVDVVYFEPLDAPPLSRPASPGARVAALPVPEDRLDRLPEVIAEISQAAVPTPVRVCDGGPLEPLDPLDLGADLDADEKGAFEHLQRVLRSSLRPFPN